jgi:hypothetical protein
MPTIISKNETEEISWCDMDYGGSSLLSGDMLFSWKWYIRILHISPIFELEVGVVVILGAWYIELEVKWF